MDSSAGTLKIITPEGVHFHLHLAGPVSRFLAWFLDLFCILALHSCLNYLLFIFHLFSRDLYQAVSMVLFFCISIGYAIVLEWFWSGQTLGKRVFRLRVMDAQGLSLTFSQVVIRNLLRFVDMLPAMYMVGGVVSLISSKNARLGDIAGNTVVIREIDIPGPDLSQMPGDKFNSLKAYPILCARLRQQIPPGLADLVLGALFRRQALDPEKRVVLFKKIAGYFQTLVVFPPKALDGLSDEQYLRNIIDILFSHRDF